MLIFVILLYFGLKVMSLSAYTADDGPATHVCVDYSTQTNKTTVKWGVSVPHYITSCELIRHEVTNANPQDDILNELQSHGSYRIPDLRRSSTWVVRVTCAAQDNVGRTSLPSPSVQFIPGNASSSHVCSDSGLGSMVTSGSDIPLVICIWVPEPHKDYAVIRWQPTRPMSGVQCTLYQDNGSRVNTKNHLPPDDMQSTALDGSNISVWLTCTDQPGKTIHSSGKVEYMQGGPSSVCSSQQHSVQSTSQTSDGIPTGPPTHGRLGITNIGTGLALGAGILVVAIVLTTIFLKWHRWQQRRRRQRLLRDEDPANEQEAMEEFQQMV